MTAGKMSTCVTSRASGGGGVGEGEGGRGGVGGRVKYEIRPESSRKKAFKDSALMTA